MLTHSCYLKRHTAVWLALLIALTASHTTPALSASTQPASPHVAKPHATKHHGTIVQKPFSASDQTVFKLKQADSLAGILQQELDARVILVGETHTRFDHHQVQLETLKFFHEKDMEIALGVEWFQQPFQQHLDDFIAGRISEKEMLNMTGYFDRWRYDYRLYRPILQYAKEHGIPVIALNSSRELNKALSEHGFDDLPEEFKAQLPESYDWSDEAYKERLSKVFKSHPDYPGTFDDFLRIQLTWDESMAERAVDYLEVNPSSRMLVLAGAGHIQFGSGIPNRIKRRLSGKVVSILASGSDTTISPDMADYLVFTTEYKLHPAGLIGVFLDMKDEKNLVVTEFSKNSAGKDAGLTEGAVIVGIDESSIVTLSDLKLTMLDKKPGEKIELHYIDSPAESRDDQKTVTVTLQ